MKQSIEMRDLLKKRGGKYVTAGPKMRYKANVRIKKV